MRKIKKISTKVLVFFIMVMFISTSILAAEKNEQTEDILSATEREETVVDVPIVTEEKATVDVAGGAGTKDGTYAEAGYEAIMELAVVAPVPTPAILAEQSWISITQNEGLDSVTGMIHVRFQDTAPESIFRIPANSELVTIAGLDTSRLGEQEVTVSIWGITATVRAWVSEPHPEPPTPGEVQSMIFNVRNDWTIWGSPEHNLHWPWAIQGRTPVFELLLFDGPSIEMGGVSNPSGNFIGTIVATVDMISGFNPNQLGTQTVTATYQGVTYTRDIYVHPPFPCDNWEYVGLRHMFLADNAPASTEPNRLLVQGESIGTMGMYMVFQMPSQEPQFSSDSVAWLPVSETTPGMTITGVDTNRVGQQDMTITFAGVVDTIRVIVVGSSLKPDTEEDGDDPDNGEGSDNDGSGNDSNDVDNSANMLVLQDVATGITLEAAPGVLPVGTRLVVNHIGSADVFNATIANALGANYSRNTSHRITLVDANGNRIQPTGNVTLSIPIPHDYNRNLLSMYHVSAAGVLTGFNYSISSDGAVLRFTTNHFSVYTIAERVAASPGAGGISSPLTGDSLAFGWSFALLAFSAISIVKLLVYRKRNK